MSMPLDFYHATTSKAARKIEQSQFRPGKGATLQNRYAGAALYFSADPENAIRHCFTAAEVVICCSVDLGKCLIAKRYAIDKDECLARGYDSVNIRKTDTYAVYDSSRISIKSFRRISDGLCWYPSAAPSADPLQIMIAAIQASPNESLNASGNLGELYSKHPSLREAVRAAGGLTDFCDAHVELTKDGHFVTMAPSVNSSAGPLEIIIEAIQASPNGSLDVSSKLGALYSKHPCLLEAVRAAGGLADFCDAHAELVKNGNFVTKAPSVNGSLKPLEIMIAAIQACPNGSLNVNGKLGELYSKHPNLHEAVRAAGGLTKFCGAHAELTKNDNFVTVTKAKPSMALERLLAAIKASPDGSLNVTSHISELCLKHRDLHEALRATGGLTGFCKAHPELICTGSRVALSEQHCRSQQLEIKREEEARQMHTKVQRQAEDERCQMQLKMEMKLKQEAARRLELQSEESARQRQAARQQAEEARQQTQLQEVFLKKQKEAEEVQMKSDKVAYQRLQQEQEASQRRQLKSKSEEASRQMLTQQHEETSHAQERMRRKQCEGGVFTQATTARLPPGCRQVMVKLSPGWEMVEHRTTGRLYYINCATGETTYLGDRAHARQQRQLQLDRVPVSPWEAFHSIVVGGIAAGFRYLLGACNGSQQ